MPEIEFTVEALSRAGDSALVDGCACKAPIRAGDVFTELHGHSHTWDAAAGLWVDVDPGPKLPVALRVESIEAYRHLLDELPSGMTARIRLSGSGAELLREDKILGGSVDHE